VITKTVKGQDGTLRKVLQFTQTESRKLSQAADVLIAAGRHDRDASEAYDAIESLIQRLVDGLTLEAMDASETAKPDASKRKAITAIANPAKK